MLQRGQGKAITAHPQLLSRSGFALILLGNLKLFEKNQDTIDLSGSVGSSEKDDKDESKEEQKKEASKSKRAETARGFVHVHFDILNGKDVLYGISLRLRHSLN